MYKVSDRRYLVRRTTQHRVRATEIYRPAGIGPRTSNGAQGRGAVAMVRERRRAGVPPLGLFGGKVGALGDERHHRGVVVQAGTQALLELRVDLADAALRDAEDR